MKKEGLGKKANKVIKNENKLKGLLSSAKEFICKHLKVILIVLSIILVLASLFFIIYRVKKHDSNVEIVTINDTTYTKADFYMYLYSVKYSYYGSGDVTLTNADLNSIVDSTTNQTLSEYLKQQTISQIKTSQVIRKYAEDNNVTLTETDEKELLDSKNAFIESLGGKKEFEKFLSKNNTTEDAYDKMIRCDKLYERTIKKYYSEDKLYDLTSEEYEKAYTSYRYAYYKIEQVILTTIDVETGKNLSDTEISQKGLLAKSVVSLAKSGEDFEKLISKYSEDSTEDRTVFYTYYKAGELLDEIEDAVKKLGTNEISDVIQTKYAYHIVKRLELDDEKLESYLQSLRENKYIVSLSEEVQNVKVSYKDAYSNIKIK